MANLNITVNEATFICRPDWTVDQAENKIRSRFGLQFGCLVEGDGAALLGTKPISSAVGAISFVEGHRIQITQIEQGGF